ncbi:MAG: class I SAM-dependent methyltransferase [Lachnospiraceae bacterium]|nr:class I SAM-dependent methyltransferase [Lachnospiraceae bacterium]
MMDTEYRERSLQYWERTHEEQDYDRDSIRVDDWLEPFDDIIMGTTRPILDLGCGGGNDTLYLINKGRQVIACDQSERAIQRIRKNFPEVMETKCFNMLDGLAFADASFEVVIADLSLHYFTGKDTSFIISELQRILVPGGYLLLRVNSIYDVNHGAGQGREVEPHLYESGAGTLKRFFDEADIRRFFKEYKIEYLKEETMTRYKLEKKLYRVCVRFEKGE